MTTPSVRAYALTDNSGATATSFVAGIPSGTQVGDLLLVQLFISSSTPITPPAGWTSLIDTTATTPRQVLYWKIATSGDISAGSATWTLSVARRGYISMLAIDGARLVNPIGASNSGTAANNTSLTTTGVTPSDVNSLILIFVGADLTGSPNSVSGYSLATSSPTFTELYDTSAVTFAFSAAWGLRPQVTATGQSSVTLSSAPSGSHSIQQIVAVTTIQQITASDTISFTESLSIIRMLKVVTSETISFLDSLTSKVSKVWNFTDKNDTDWTFKDKDE